MTAEYKPDINFSPTKDWEVKIRNLARPGSVWAVDGDLVLIDLATECVNEFNARFGTQVSIYDIDGFNAPTRWAEKFNVPTAEAKKFDQWIWYDSDVLARCRPHNGAIRALKRLNALGVEIHISTARIDELKEVTSKWFGNWVPKGIIEAIHHNPNKHETALEIGADVQLEDGQHHIDQIILHTPKTYAAFVPYGNTICTLPEEVLRNERLIILPRGRYRQGISPLTAALAV